jgi:hypothetical protein
MRRFFISLGLVLAAIAPDPAGAQQKYEVDLSKIRRAIEKKPYTFGGFLEFEPVLARLDHDAIFYRLKYSGQDGGDISAQYGFGLRIHGSYQKKFAALHFTADSLVRRNSAGWEGKARLFEGYLSLKSGPNYSLDIGKRVLKWGKGYAWNPVAFLDRPKDPEDPQEALEGFYVVSANLVKSFSGALKTVAFTPALVPVTRDVNSDFGNTDSLNIGGKLYLLLLDTDLDFLFVAGGARDNRFGLDFARNLRSNLEIHGEMAWIQNHERRYLDGEGKLTSAKSDATSALFGLRYLTANEVTIIGEYYHNGTGFLEEEVQSYYRFASESCCGITGLQGIWEIESLRSSFSRSNPMRDYLYFRASQKEPFNLLYLTPEITSIINAKDHSFLLMPGVTYSPKINLRIRFRGAVLVGGENDEFGEKQSDYRLELRLRYFF